MVKCSAIKHDSIMQGDALNVLKCLKNNSVDLIITSPPYAQLRIKDYGGISPDKYREWFIPISREMKRVLRDDGNLVLNLKENTVNGERHPYVYETVLAMRNDGWKWRDTLMWHKKNPFPIKPIYHLKDASEYIYHFSKSNNFKFYPNEVMENSKEDTCARIQRGLNQKTFNHNSPNMNRYKRNYANFSKRNFDCTKSYPSNVLVMAVGKGKTTHPARFPNELPNFFIKLLSKKGDVVLDPFTGSGTTNIEAKKLCRKSIGIDIKPEYVNDAKKRFEMINSNC